MGLSYISALRITLILFLGMGLHFSEAQNVITDLDPDAHRAYDRIFILTGGGPVGVHTSIKPYWRKDLVGLADSSWLNLYSVVSRYDAQKIWDQNNEFVRTEPALQDPVTGMDVARYRTSGHSLWNTFYKTPSYAYEVDVHDFYLRVNPVFHLAIGRESEEGVTTFTNQRGITLRGGVGQNVFFQTSVLDNQIRYPNYINAFTGQYGVIPGAGLYKDFTSKLFDFTQGRDFLLANAYVGINLGKYIGVQLGHNQAFIGDGIRSLFLSGFSTPVFSLRINTRIWKFHYQNIFAELAADDFHAAVNKAEPVPKKFMAAHYLSFRPSPTVSIGLFESVVFDRSNHQFELQYLNPIILYRTVESSLGSPDNVLLGLNARVDLWKSVSVYGQFILDDLSVSNILDGHLDWWGNKFGHQLGIKYLNVLSVENLDMTVEWNQVRPYTYSHYNETANYSHYKQPLAHPLGANFKEWIVSAEYPFTSRLRLSTSLYMIQKGEDADSVSFGGNVIAPNTRRPGDFGHHIGQGVATDLVFWRTVLRFELMHDVWVDGMFLYRNKSSDLATLSQQTTLFQLGVRYNIYLRDDVF